MPGTVTFITNVIAHDFQIKDEAIGVVLDQETTFINLCDSFDKHEMLPIFVHPSNFSLLNRIPQVASRLTPSFLRLWIATRQSLFPPITPRSWENQIMICFILRMFLTFHAPLMVMFFLNSPFFIYDEDNHYG